MFGLTWPEIIAIVLGIVAIAKTLLDINSGVKDPNIKQDAKIQSLEDGCAYKHKGIDEKFTEINRVLTLIQENELKHIEANINSLFIGQEKIMTILEERLPKK